MPLAKPATPAAPPPPGRKKGAGNSSRGLKTPPLADFASLDQDPDELKCHNCQGVYSASEARVQRSLRQMFKGLRPVPSSVTPQLCWVCTRLYYSSRELDPMDKMWVRFTEGGLAE